MKGYDNIFDLKTQIYSLSESRIFADDTDYADFKRFLLVECFFSLHKCQF